MPRRGAVVVVALCSLALVAAGTSCGESASSGGDRSTTSASTGPPRTLPFESVTKDELAQQLGVKFPADTADFLTARLPNRSQLDVTFTVPAAAVASFASASGFPRPVAGQRVISHTSPLWKLNPDATINGSVRTVTTNTGDRLRVALEFVDEGPGRARARMVVVPG
ncbi:MAG: hypothetical protein ACKOYM_06015 [Actinomycetes bacterium]